MKTARQIIEQINVSTANLDHIMRTGTINGSLLVDLEKAMEEYLSEYSQAYQLRQSELVNKLYARIKELESPIEQKVDYKVERQRFIDDYANNRERENMTDSLGRIFDMWIIPLACRIKELESQPLPIEGGGRERFSVEEGGKKT